MEGLGQGLEGGRNVQRFRGGLVFTWETWAGPRSEESVLWFPLLSTTWREREFVIDNLLFRIHLIIEMILVATGV